jgi:Domain of unknown function (DUF5753)
VLRPGGPEYEIILDEVGLRRFSVPPDVMYAQLHHVIKIAETQPPVTLRVFPLVTGVVTALMPKSPIMVFTFPAESDPPMAVASTVFADLVYTEPEKVSGYVNRYTYVRNEALSEVSSLTFLSDLADQITSTLGPFT